jgi:hypothetical protein
VGPVRRLVNRDFSRLIEILHGPKRPRRLRRMRWP